MPQTPITEEPDSPQNVISLAERLRLRRPVRQPGQWDGDPGFVGGFYQTLPVRRNPTDEDYERAKKLALDFVNSRMEDLM